MDVRGQIDQIRITIRASLQTCRAEPAFHARRCSAVHPTQEEEADETPTKLAEAAVNQEAQQAAE
jgi:hypothetical protein